MKCGPFQERVWNFFGFLNDILRLILRIDKVNEEKAFRRGSFLIVAIIGCFSLFSFGVISITAGLLFMFVLHVAMSTLVLAAIIIYLLFPFLYKFVCAFSVFIFFVGFLLMFIVHYNFDMGNDSRVFAYTFLILFIAVCSGGPLLKILYSICLFIFINIVFLYEMIRTDRFDFVMDRFEFFSTQIVQHMLTPIFAIIVIQYFVYSKTRSERLLIDVIRGISHLNFDSKSIQSILTSKKDDSSIPEYQKLLKGVVLNVQSYLPYIPSHLQYSSSLEKLQEEEEKYEEHTSSDSCGTNPGVVEKGAKNKKGGKSSKEVDETTKDDESSTLSASSGCSSSESSSESNSDTTASSSKREQQSSSSSSHSSFCQNNKKNNNNLFFRLNKNNNEFNKNNHKNGKKKKKKRSKLAFEMNEKLMKGTYLDFGSATVGLVNLTGFHSFMRKKQRQQEAGTAHLEKERMDFKDDKEIIFVHSKYIEQINSLIQKHGGIVHYFFGDRIVFSFNSTKRCVNHSLRAVHASIEIINKWKEFQKEYKKLHKRRMKKEEPSLLLPSQEKVEKEKVEKTSFFFPSLRISIVTDRFHFGNIGSETLRRFSILGDSVSRLHVMNDAFYNYENEILIDFKTKDMIKYQISSKVIDVVQLRQKNEKEKGSYHKTGMFQVFRVLHQRNSKQNGSDNNEWMYEIESLFFTDEQKKKNNENKENHNYTIKNMDFEYFSNELFVLMKEDNWKQAKQIFDSYFEACQNQQQQESINDVEEVLENHQENKKKCKKRKNCTSEQIDDEILQQKLSKEEFIRTIF